MPQWFASTEPSTRARTKPGLHPLVIDRVEPQTSHIAKEQQASTPVDICVP